MKKRKKTLRMNISFARARPPKTMDNTGKSYNGRMIINNIDTCMNQLRSQSPPPPFFFFHIVLPGTEDIFLKNFSPITDQNFSSTN